MNILTMIANGIVSIINAILQVLKFHGIFALVLFIFIIGAQLFSKRHSVNNFLKLNDIDVTEEELKDIIKSKKIPLDGWIATIGICLIPLFNIEYAIFCIIIGLIPEDSRFIVENRDIIKMMRKNGDIDD